MSLSGLDAGRTLGLPWDSAGAVNVNKAYSTERQSKPEGEMKEGEKLSAEKRQAKQRKVVFTKNGHVGMTHTQIHTHTHTHTHTQQAGTDRGLMLGCNLFQLFVGPPEIRVQTHTHKCGNREASRH